MGAVNGTTVDTVACWGGMRRRVCLSACEACCRRMSDGAGLGWERGCVRWQRGRQPKLRVITRHVDKSSTQADCI